MRLIGGSCDFYLMFEITIYSAPFNLHRWPIKVGVGVALLLIVVLIVVLAKRFVIFVRLHKIFGINSRIFIKVKQ